jgi:hypothetical protein
MTKATPDFHYVVALLRQLEPRYQLMALYAAQFWSGIVPVDVELGGAALLALSR